MIFAIFYCDFLLSLVLFHIFYLLAFRRVFFVVYMLLLTTLFLTLLYRSAVEEYATGATKYSKPTTSCCHYEIY